MWILVTNSEKKKQIKIYSQPIKLLKISENHYICQTKRKHLVKISTQNKVLMLKLLIIVVLLKEG